MFAIRTFENAIGRRGPGYFVWSAPRQSGFAGVSCVSPDWCLAVGQKVDQSGARVPLVEVWNGHR
ncbi:MAG TPA: hypothetical protein VIV12_08900 [Streptosporangiaceae bacterium]